MSAGPIIFCATGVENTVGGIASANRNVLKALERLGDETGRSVKVLAFNETEGDRPGYRTFASAKGRFALASLAAAPGAGLMVFDHVRLSEPVLALPRFMRAPVAVCAHGSEATWRIRPSSVAAFRRAELVMTNSHYTLERMAQYVPEFRGQPCPLGLSPQFELTPAPPARSDETIRLSSADGRERKLGERVLLLVARMDATEREKGHRELMAVMPALTRDHPDAQLVLAGSGSDIDDLRALAAGSAAAGNIFLPGRVDDATLAALYRKAYAYVMPSRQEGFGLVYLEAMNQAAPCLACRDDGGGEVVVDGETGVLAPREFTDADLLAGLNALLVDPARARSYGEAGWRRLRDLYTSQAHQDRVADMLRPLITGG